MVTKSAPRKGTKVANNADTFINVTWHPDLVSIPRNNRYCAVACDVRSQGFRNTRVYESTREGLWIVSGIKNDIRHYAYIPDDLVARIKKFDEQRSDKPRKIGGTQKTWKLEVFRAEAVIHKTEEEKQRMSIRDQEVKTGQREVKRRGNTSGNVGHGRFPAVLVS